MLCLLKKLCLSKILPRAHIKLPLSLPLAMDAADKNALVDQHHNYMTLLQAMGKVWQKLFLFLHL